MHYTVHQLSWLLTEHISTYVLNSIDVKTATVGLDQKTLESPRNGPGGGPH